MHKPGKRAVSALDPRLAEKIVAEAGPIDGHRASLYGWWDFVMSIPAPRVIVVHDIDEPRGQGAQWGEVQANIHRALGCVGVVTDGSVRDLDEVRALADKAFDEVLARVTA